MPASFHPRSTRMLVMLLVAVSVASIVTAIAAARNGFERIARNEQAEITRGVGQLMPAYQLKIAEKQESVYMERFLLTGDPHLLAAWNKNEQEFRRAIAKLRDAHRGAQPELDQLEALDVRDEQGKDLIIALWRAGRHEEAKWYYINTAQPIKLEINTTIDDLIDRQKADLAALHDEVLAVEEASMRWLIALAGVLPLLVLLVALAVGRRVLGTLQAANEELARQSRFKDEFLSVVSHELRTPLHYMRGFTSLLQRETAGPLTPVQRRYLHDVQQASERMLRLVEELLDGAALQAGKLTLEVRELDYAGLVQDVIGQMRPLAEGKQLELVTELAPAGTLRADPRRLAQVLTNLLANAIRFTPNGGRIELAVRPAPGGLRTEVRDTGVGIAADQLPKLFQRFSQLDMSSTRPSGGSGLGLWICKGIVEAHGGRIEATSQPNVGSTFGFTLPVAS